VYTGVFLRRVRLNRAVHLLGQDRVTTRIFFAILLILVAWGMSTPLLAGPDEPQHMVKAQALVRGDFDSPFEGPEIPAGAQNCYAFQRTVTAECAELPWSESTVRIETATENYPPVYHALIGPITLTTEGKWRGYGMRFVSIVLCSLLIAFGLRTLLKLRPHSIVIVGSFFAMTPMTIHLMSTVSPSALATATSFLLGATLLAVRTSVPVARPLIHQLGFATTLLLVLRRDSLLWVAVIGLFGLWLVPWPRVREVATDKSMLLWMPATLISVALQMFLWSGNSSAEFVQSGKEQNEVFSHGTWLGLANLNDYVSQTVGKFGWLDVELPGPLYTMFYFALGGFLFLALLVGKRRLAVSIGLGLGMWVAAAAIIGYLRFPYFQGRYAIGFMLCVLLACVVAIAEGNLPKQAEARFMSIFGALYLIGHVVSYLQNIRRYTVGLDGSWFSYQDAAWTPPYFGWWLPLIILLFGLAIAARITLQANREVHLAR
jgi:hypothetical protein